MAQLKLPKKEKKVFPIIRGDLLDKFVSLKELDKIKFPMTLFVQECKDIAQKVVEFACCRSMMTRLIFSKPPMQHKVG